MGDEISWGKVLQSIDIYVSPKGDDAWSGQLYEPNEKGTDGPFATLQKAKDTIRELKAVGRLYAPAVVWLREGIYELSQPLVFTPEDSAPVTYCAWPGEKPVISGGHNISGWEIEELHGRTVWTMIIPEAANNNDVFRQLFINGERRTRARLPREGFYWMTDVPGIDYDAKLFEGTNTFQCAPGDVQAWENLEDAEVVVLHYWTEERMPIASFDPEKHLVTSSRTSVFSLKDDFNARYAKYYVDNVMEGLQEPGDWYVNRRTGKLTYIPLPEEKPDSTMVTIPAALQLIQMDGSPKDNRFVEYIRFQGLQFSYTDWVQPDRFSNGRPGINFTGAGQAAANIPGVVSMQGARYCSFEDCTISHVGWYGVEISDGCSAIRIVNNDIFDMGAGGIKISGSGADGPVWARTGNNVITDNHIYDGGHIYASGIGILLRHSFGNDVSHNHIHDLYYTGISCGWIWGYAQSVSCNNLICKNHIHDLGKGILSDMGGIYTLGVQPGTVLQGNWIHDIQKSNYGGWGIYMDEGSSHILSEGNLVYNTSSQGFNQHYGKENIVRNNIFAFGGEGIVSLGRAQEHNSFSFFNNILLSNNQPIYVGGYGGQLEKRNFISNMNILWDMSKEQPMSGNQLYEDGINSIERYFTMEEIQAMGYDTHSVTVNPGFQDADHYNFTLTEDSLAPALGFQPIDLSDVGPRRSKP